MKTKTFILAFFLSISSLFCYAQGYIYNEDFSSKGNWPEATNSTRSIEVKNGKYYFEHFKDDENWNVTTRDIDINTSSNFEIEMSFQKISGKKSYATGLMYGAKDKDNTYHFVLSEGQYRVSEKKDGTFKAIKSWTSSSSIKTGYYDYNKLKIVKKGSSMYYYINGTLVTTQSFKPFFGKKLAILVYNKQKVAVDYFKVKQGKSTTTTSSSKSKTILFEGFNNNNNDWSITNTSDVNLNVTGGDYIFDHKRTSGGWSSTIFKKYIATKNFRVSAQFKKKTGINDNGYGLVLGRKDGDNQNQFYISGKGSFSISKHVNGTRSYLKEWTKSSHIKTGNGVTNILTVKKTGSKTEYLINSKVVYTSYSYKSYGDRTGFVVYDKQKVAIGYLSITGYSENTTTITKNTDTKSKTILFEGFNSNNNNWSTTNTSDVNQEVTGGDYVFDHKRTSGGWSSTIIKEYDPSKDFRVSAQFKKKSGITNNGYGLVLGRKDGNNQNQFYISGLGSFSISKHVNGTRSYLKEWTKSSHIKTGNGVTNILTVKKTGSKIEYLINSKVVYTNYSYKSYGDRTGFVVYDKQKIAIGYLSITGHSKNTTPTITKKTGTSEKTIWEDDFTTNKNNWAVQDDAKVKLELKNDRYYFEHKRTTAGFSSTKYIDIDTSKDFEIESKILKVSGIKNNGFGFTFGRKDSNNQFIFSITSNGSYSIDQYKDGKFKAIKDWTKSSHIKTGNFAYNTLKIKKERGFIKFYVNDRYLTLYTHKPFMGKRLGFIVYNKQKIAVIDFKVKYINQKNNTTNTNTTIVANGENVLTEYFTDNKNEWPTGDTKEKNISVANSFYNFEHKLDKGGWAVNIDKTIDTSRDFEIKTNIKKVSGVTNYSYGLQWGKEGNNSFRFYLTGSGYYKIVRVVDNKEEIIKKFTLSSAVKKGNGSINTLRLVKQGDHYKFYVNDTYLTQTNFESFYGHRLGFVVFNKQKIGVDNIYIKYLKKSNKTIVTSNTLKVPLKESFTSNSNGWNLTDNSNVKTRISNGKLYLKNNTEKGGAFISKKVGIDTSKDFIIETSITRLTSASKGSIAFAFGRQNNTNEFDLFLSSDGSYLLRKLEKDVSNKLIPWTSTSALNTNAYQANKIKIVKSGNLLRLYINDQYVNEAPYSKFFGNYIGFSVYNRQEISIDYLNVSYPTASFNTPPEVVILEPTVQRGFKIVKTKRILVKGKATDKDGIYEVIINGIDATIADDGSFTANVPLKIGTNDFIVKATDLKQASSTKRFTIKRKSPDVVDVDDPVVVKKDKKIDTGFGQYYALLIGVSDYGDGAITDLGGLPTKDAKDLGNVLINKYNFKRENVVILNNSPKANDIIKEFSKLKKKITSKDNLLVFYAGHGVYDEVSQVGHWLPSDADMEYELNLISNSQVVDFLKSIQSKHTLLISDACFSGSIFKTRSFEKSPKSIQKKYELTSRKAITSGTLKTVPNKSMFLKYLLKRLENNTSLYLSARQLFNRIEEPVMNNSPNTPQYGTIYGIGDEGGDFIFIKN